MNKYIRLFSFCFFILCASFVQANFPIAHPELFKQSHKFVILELQHLDNGITVADVLDYKSNFRVDGKLYFLTQNSDNLKAGEQLRILGMYEFLDAPGRWHHPYNHFGEHEPLIEGVGYFLTEQGEVITHVYKFKSWYTYFPNRNNDDYFFDRKKYPDKLIPVKLESHLERSSLYEVLFDVTDSSEVWAKNLGDNNVYCLGYPREQWDNFCGNFGECDIPKQCTNCPVTVISAKKSDILDVQNGCLNLNSGEHLGSPSIRSPQLHELMQNFSFDVIKNELARRSENGVRHYFYKNFMDYYGDYFEVSTFGLGIVLCGQQD